MALMEFQPENELEQAIVKAKQGTLPVKEMMNLVAGSVLYVLGKGKAPGSGQSKVNEDWRTFDPLLLDVKGEPAVAAFSSLARAQSHGHKPEYILKIRGLEHILMLPPGYGLALNPGYVTQLMVPPNGILELKKHLKSAAQAAAPASVDTAEFKPENDFEKDIVSARQGVLPIEQLMNRLADSDIYVSSKRPVEDGFKGLDPLLFVEDKETFVGVFSAETRPEMYSVEAKYVLKIKARDFIKALSPKYGLIINPGYSGLFTVPPAGLAEFRKRFPAR